MTTNHGHPKRRVTLLTAAALALGLAIAPVGAIAQDDVASIDGDFAVLTRGELFTDDLARAQEMHDAIAAGGEEPAKAAGDFYHLAALSTGLLGAPEDTFLGIDRWSTAEPIEAFYSDPGIAEAFGQLFAGAPTVEIFERRSDWHEWGEMPDPSSDDPFWIAIVRGTLNGADDAANQAAHDPIAAGGQEGAVAAGDIAHIVYTSLADPNEFLVVDVWTSDENIEAVYGNPDFQAAFATLFDMPPTLVVYRSTDWYQW